MIILIKIWKVLIMVILLSIAFNNCYASSGIFTKKNCWDTLYQDDYFQFNVSLIQIDEVFELRINFKYTGDVVICHDERGYEFLSIEIDSNSYKYFVGDGIGDQHVISSEYRIDAPFMESVIFKKSKMISYDLLFYNYEELYKKLKEKKLLKDEHFDECSGNFDHYYDNDFFASFNNFLFFNVTIDLSDLERLDIKLVLC